MEAPIPLPDSPGAREVSWVMDSAVARSVSPFTLTEQVYAWPGQRWSVILKLPPMSVEDGQKWQGWFAKLNGAEGSFYVRDSAFLETTELGLGTPELAGDHVAGTSVLTRNWTPDRLVLAVGQRVEIGGRIRQATEDCYSDAAGNATLSVWPHCRALPDAQPVVWYQPRGVFRLRSVPEFTWDRNRMQAGFQFSADEVILP